MTPLLVSAVTVAFVTGTGVGVMWREAVELLLGRDDLMALLHRLRIIARAVLDHRTTISTWAVVLSFLVTLGLSVAVGITLHQSNKSDAQFQAQSACQAKYNRLSALARDERLAAQSMAAVAEISIVHADLDVWRGLRTTLSGTHGTLAQVLDVIDKRIDRGRHYLGTLQHQQQVRRLHAYPPADYCTHNGGRTR